jgi:hypothetical protein
MHVLVQLALTRAPKEIQKHTNQGAAEKIKRGNDVHLRQLAKKSTRTFIFIYFLVRFWAFLGKGSSKTRDFF